MSIFKSEGTPGRANYKPGLMETLRRIMHALENISYWVEQSARDERQYRR